ncbi:MAG: N-acetylglucosamine-6-phosphate deacetylase [Clostridia bacterium]|nr:N-acetylglucosamine-6-phosphate deacetylase [Clostridia bacterium]
MKIINGLVFGADHKMHEKELCFENGVITEVSAADDVYDAAGCYVLPGFIDTHIHGANGVEFYGAEGDLKPALDWLTLEGVTSVMPSMATDYPEGLVRAVDRIVGQHDDRIIGIHAEGPFINVIRKGGMAEERIQAPSAALTEEMYVHSKGLLKLMTMAPELPGTEEVIEVCKKYGIKLSMGHTNATYEEAKAGVDAGFSRATHTYNAMRPLNHRDPGILGLALTDDRVTCELICDEHHVSPPAMQIVVRCKGPEKVTMISDNSFYAGLPEGEYGSEDGRKMFVKDGFCKLENGTICGSAVSLAVGAKNMFARGFKPEEIAVMACVNPAKAADCADRGELIPGMRADVIVLDKTFTVQAVFSAGKRVR